MSCSGTIWILFMGTLECARVVEVLLMARTEWCIFRDKSGVLVTPL